MHDGPQQAAPHRAYPKNSPKTASLRRTSSCYWASPRRRPPSIWEAQVAEFPIVATDMGGVRDIVPFSAGFLVPAARSDALAGKLVVLSDHPERWPDRGRPGAPIRGGTARHRGA